MANAGSGCLCSRVLTLAYPLVYTELGRYNTNFDQTSQTAVLDRTETRTSGFHDGNFFISCNSGCT